MVNIYVSVVRPVLEYACPVWPTNLPKYLSDNIEMIQKRPLKSIFPNKGYDDIMYDLGMCTLHERRNVICEQYFKKMQGNSHKLHHLLPEKKCIHYDMRRENKYPLTKNRTNPWGSEQLAVSIISSTRMPNILFVWYYIILYVVYVLYVLYVFESKSSSCK